MLSPVSRGSTRDGVDRYMAEPYVIAADVYGVAPHVGRAGWTWYTGSAGWMYRVALESILGFELEGGRVVRLRPCIPTEWPGFTLRYARHEFRVRRAPAGHGTSFGEGTDVAPRVDQGAIVLDLVNDGRTHIVEIALGADVGPKYVGAHDA
jgi:cyclic beta-1,2-glucan synthetase